MSSDISPPSDGLQAETIFPHVRLGGLPIAVCRPEDAAQRICALANQRPRLAGTSIHLVNAYTVALAHRNPKYHELLSNSSGNLPDGKPLTWIGRLLGGNVRQVRGPSLFQDVFDVGRKSEIKHFLLGSSPETLTKLTSALISRFPGVQIVGEYSPPFRSMTSEEVEAQDRAIVASGADIVWVGLGTPKQDFEVTRLAAQLPQVAIAVGAAFDFVAGTKREAPRWMTASGLEWLYRLLSEPRRLWRRYLVGNLEFLWAVAVKR